MESVNVSFSDFELFSTDFGTSCEVDISEIDKRKAFILQNFIMEKSEELGLNNDNVIDILTEYCLS
jgi:hypothetical protein